MNFHYTVSVLHYVLVFCNFLKMEFFYFVKFMKIIQEKRYKIETCTFYCLFPHLSPVKCFEHGNLTLRVGSQDPLDLGIFKKCDNLNSHLTTVMKVRCLSSKPQCWAKEHSS